MVFLRILYFWVAVVVRRFCLWITCGIFHDFLQFRAVKAAESPRHASLFPLISLQLTTIVSIQPPPSQLQLHDPYRRSFSKFVQRLLILKNYPGGIQSQSEKENELLWTNNNGWWTLLLEVITTTKIAVRETYKVNDITNVCFIPSTWIVKWKISTIICFQGLAESKTGVGDEDVRNTAVNLVMVSLLEPLFFFSPTVNFVLLLLVKTGWKIRLSRGTPLPKVNNGHYFYHYLGFSLILFLWLCDRPTLNSELIKTRVRFKSLKIYELE